MTVDEASGIDRKEMDESLKVFMDGLAAKLDAIGVQIPSADQIKKDREDVAAALAKSGESAAEVARLAEKVTELRAILRSKYGEAGADEWRKTLGKFICGAFQYAKTGRVRDDCKIDGFDYAAAAGEDYAKVYTIGTAATAGSLIPTAVLPGLMALRQVIGVIIPKCMSITIPPLSSMVVNSDSVMPTAAYILTEGNALSNQTTMEISTDTVSPKLIGSTVTVQNELLNFPGIGFAEIMGVRMMEAIIAKEEYGILAGTVAGTYPSEGVTGTVTGLNAQTALATATVQNMLTFLGECVADFPGSYMTSENQLFISPARYFALAGEAVGTNVGAALAWANPTTGVPPTFFGYPLLQHPGAVNIAGTTHSVILGNPKTIVFAHSGQIAVDFNPYATGTNTGWLANNTWMRAMTHSDWSIGAPKSWHKATITA